MGGECEAEELMNPTQLNFKQFKVLITLSPAMHGTKIVVTWHLPSDMSAGASEIIA